MTQADAELVRRLHDIHEHDWRISFLAHTSDTAKAAAARIEALAARVEKLEAALRQVRSKGIIAGAAFVRRNPDGKERAKEVLDIIDTALEKAP